MTIKNKIKPTQPKHITFRLAEMEDAEFILNLRLDDTKNRYLSKVKSDLQGQQTWLKQYKEREKNNLEYYYIILGAEQQELGVVRIYDFQDDSFCWGSWILCKGAPPYAAIESAILIYETAFYELGFNRSHFDVRKNNVRVFDFHKRFGAVVVKEDTENFYLTITKETYETTKKRYRKFFRSY